MMAGLWYYAILLVTLVGWVTSDSSKPKGEGVPGPYHFYRTEPTFDTNPIIVIKNITKQRSLLQGGYFFISPFGNGGIWGPQIIDQQGNLIWYGKPSCKKWFGNYRRAQDLKLCDYKGKKFTHLCWSEGAGGGAGVNRIFNNSYHPVEKDYEPHKGELVHADPHEFNMLRGGKSFLQLQGKKLKMDLRPYKGSQDGYVLDGCFDEIDVATREILFHWCFLDHLPVWHTYLFLNTQKINQTSLIAGEGRLNNPWDFLHMNAIDKNSEGDYIASCRHLNLIIKIAGKNNVHGVPPGKILWKLGGKYSDIAIDGNALFSRQHDVRFVHTGPKETVITLFNNAWEGINKATARVSSGLRIRINNETMKAHMLNIYPHPEDTLSPAQGSFQDLPNGNVLVGWGTIPDYTEYTKNGTVLYHARFSDQNQINYRTFKYPWRGRPPTKPKLIAYCYSCNFQENPLVSYVSWNGDTRTTAWRFSISNIGKEGPWFPVGTFPKKGFETKVQLSSKLSSKIIKFAGFIKVEAIDDYKNVVSTVVEEIFVPLQSKKKDCDQNGCFKPKQFIYERKLNMGRRCMPSFLPMYIVFGLICVGIESAEYLLQVFTEQSVGFGEGDIYGKPVTSGMRVRLKAGRAWGLLGRVRRRGSVRYSVTHA